MVDVFFVVDSINESWDLAARGWEFGLAALKVGAYVVLFLMCRRYEDPRFFLQGYFFADLLAHVVRGFTERKRLTRMLVELVLYLGLGVWMMGDGKILPEQPGQIGMVALAFICFGTVKMILASRRWNWVK